MKCTCEKELKQKLEPFLEDYNDGDLIPVLQNAQEIYGLLPVSVLELIAEKTGVRLSKIIGVVTFYTQFRTKPAGKNLILLCQGTACHVNGSAEIETAIRGYLQVEEGETTLDGLFTYNNVACIGCCSLSPVMMINGKAYGNLTRESTVRILKDIAGHAENSVPRAEESK